ncbi:Plant organelle RNA recognition domain [Sesbania bispinosa]|nr:Plant organelle RNA recognition domain [Sesbania bispinosa]
MALCLPFSFSNHVAVTSLSSSFLSGTTPSSFPIHRKPKSYNLRSVTVSISCSSIKTVRDRYLDRHVVMKNKIRFVQKLKTLLLSKPKHYLPIHILSKCRSYLALPKPRSILTMIHRYPSIFELFTIPWPPTPINATKLYPQLCVRLTPAAAALAAEELNLQSSISIMLATKLQKLLMLSSHHRLLLSKLVHLAPDLGLPPNFRSRLCNDHPDKFKIVDTSYGRALELVSWDLSLAKPLQPPAFRSDGLIVDRPLKFKQLRLRKGLNLKRAHQDFLLKFEEMPEMCPYRNPAEALAKESIEAEKRCCALVREVLGMTIEKRTLLDHLTHFRKEFGLPNKLRGMVVRHPELFYGIQEMRREKRKGRVDKDVGSLSGTNQNNDDSDVDYDDDTWVDNFEDDYDDGFEDIFEDLDFEAEDDDHSNKLFANQNGEFWTAGPSPIQNGLGEAKAQPW